MPTQRPNILYVICHDLGKQLGCYGLGLDSPNLDRFAAGGALFGSAFCNSPACSPSRGCAMSGQYAHTNGLMGLVNQGWSMPESTRTIVDELNDAGYQTAHFGLQYVQMNKRFAAEFKGGPDAVPDSALELPLKLYFARKTALAAAPASGRSSAPRCG